MDAPFRAKPRRATRPRPDWRLVRTAAPKRLAPRQGNGEGALQAYSEEVNELLIDEQRREVEQGIVVGEIKDLKRFWPQFGVNLAGGFVSALLFAALLVLVTFFVLSDTSPVEIAKQLRHDMEAVEDGEEN